MSLVFAEKDSSHRDAIICFIALAAALIACRPCNAGTTSQTRPEIFCEFSSSRAPIDKEQVRMHVDGRDVTNEAVVLAWRVSYTPSEPLLPGRHFVHVAVKDMQGSSGEKRWDFVIDPNAGDAQRPALAFAPPTPVNGAALTNGRGITISVLSASPHAVLASAPVFKLIRNGTPFAAPDAWAIRNGAASLSLPDLPPGRYAATLSMPGASSEISTAFIVTPDPPRIASFAIEPEPETQDLSAELVIEDESGAGVDSCTIAFSRNGQAVSTKAIRAAAGHNRLLMHSSAVEASPDGIYAARIQCTDSAGRATDWAGPVEFTLSEAPSQLAALDSPSSRNDAVLTIHALPSSVADPHIDVSGKAPAGAVLALYVNDMRVMERSADSTGAFLFGMTPLDPGLNSIVVAMEDSAGLAQQESVPTHVTYHNGVTAIAQLPQPEPDPIVEPEPADEIKPDIETNPGTEPQPVIETEPAVEPEPIDEPEPDIDAKPDIDQKPEPDSPPQPEPVELTIHVPHGAEHGNELPVHADAPPGSDVALFLNGIQIASVTANNGGQAHFKDVPFVEGMNELYVTTVVNGIEYRSPAVSVHIEPRGRDNR